MSPKSRFSYLLIFILGYAISCASPSTETYDLWIKNALIIDGTGSDPFWGQVLVNGEEIALVDRDTTKSYTASEVIDAKGRVLTPGFIDAHSHGNPLETPEFTNFLAMGATTIFLGQDGSSPSTTDLGGWMDKVDSLDLGPNIAMFVGHGTLRMLSGIQYDKDPTEEGLLLMDSLLVDAMEAGSFGLSTGLEYNPGYLAGQDELNRLAKITGEHGGMVMSHMRNEDDEYMEESLAELLAQGWYCPVHVSHIKIVYAKGEERAKEILAILDSERNQGKTVTADVYPYEASYTGISLLFPDWAKPPANYDEVVAQRRQELEKYLRNRVNLRNGPQATLMGTGAFKGKTLKEIAEELGKPFEKVLVEDIGLSGSAAYFVMDEEVMKTFLKDPNICVSSDGSPTSNHPRGHGTFAKIIESYVIEEPLLSLSEAIHKMTELTARKTGISDRGLIREGMAADLLVFDPELIKATATYENPYQLAEGFDVVLVNGKIAFKDGKPMGRQGRVLRKVSSGKAL
ncbi:N-acyl-D-amino-acid deacylase family protein [Pleomorphovibrio marinus]|uniref:N-acyl-D-amino-acid deacylase family protein n=1 Tax=Pleomorphovibrio marinus TaxID=2164132 RepID=UPI000E0BD41E|nr:amidohydrolase family protein [Pleomorphovibrio marinus]